VHDTSRDNIYIALSFFNQFLLIVFLNDHFYNNHDIKQPFEHAQDQDYNNAQSQSQPSSHLKRVQAVLHLL
jgi:hypothetical protein